MIINTGMKREVFLRTISLHLTGSDRFGEERSGEKLVYFGAGYWRGRWNKTNTSIRLINPSISWADTLTVEKALCILLCGKFELED